GSEAQGRGNLPRVSRQAGRAVEGIALRHPAGCLCVHASALGRLRRHRSEFPWLTERPCGNRDEGRSPRRGARARAHEARYLQGLIQAAACAAWVAWAACMRRREGKNSAEANTAQASAPSTRNTLRKPPSVRWSTAIIGTATEATPSETT